MAHPTSTTPEWGRSRMRPWWTLAGACAGLFVLMLDSTVVALALPSIRRDVGASATGLQWVMNVYLLAITMFVVTAGRLGDTFGRKRVVPDRRSSAAPFRPSSRRGRSGSGRGSRRWRWR